MTARISAVLAVALLAIGQLAATTAPGAEFESASQTQTTLAFVVFTFPLVVVSIVAGMLADRVSKRTVIILMKSAEVLLMSAATLSLWLNPAGGIWPLIVLAGSRSAGQNCKKRPHLELTVSGRQSVVR